MRRCTRVVLTLGMTGVVLWLAANAWAALPSQQPDSTAMLDGRVKALVQAGGHIWVGGQFSHVLNASGQTVANVDNLVALDPVTGALEPGVNQPRVTNGSGAAVFSLSLGPNGNLYLAGRFNAVNGVPRKNAAAIDPVTGDLLAFNPNAGEATAVYASDSAVYVGTDKLLSFQFNGSPTPGYSPPQVSVNGSLRGHNTPPQIRDIDEVGSDLVFACQCDSLQDRNGQRGVKALVRVDASTGNWTNWSPAGLDAQSAAFGIALIVRNNPNGVLTVYLAAGGSDFTAAYTFASGAQQWKTDTSGSSQDVTWFQGNLIIGGHFNWTQSPGAGSCGSNDAPNTNCYHTPKLVAMDPANGHVVLVGSGDPWNPGICCKYNGVWALLTDNSGSFLHVGGEFTRAGGSWSGSGNNWNLTGYQKQQYYARFSAPPPGQSRLTVTKAGTGGGSVTSTPAGIDCGDTCAAYFTDGSNVTLRADPGPNATFKGWSGDCSGTGTCQVTMNGARNVTATFAATYQLHVSKKGNGAGRISSSPAGIDCGGTCTAGFADGTVVTLSLDPGANSTFVGWGGACSGTGTCRVTMDADTNVTARIRKNVPPTCRILFVSDRKGNGDIFVMNADGSGVRDLTNSPAPDADPAWSPDCTRIVFSSTRGGNADLYVMNADGSGVKLLRSAAGDDIQPSWSPDGTKIAFVNDHTGNRQLYVMNSFGNNVTRITNNQKDDDQPDWAPGGGRIVFASDVSGVTQLYTIQPDGSHRRQLAKGAKAMDQPSWSPDGTHILYVGRSSGTPQIWMLTLKTGRRTRITFDGQVDTHPAWSPNGKRLAYSSNAGRNRNIWTIGAGGAGRSRLTKGPAADVAPSWAS